MLEGILSISGQPGLYKLVSQTKNGIIVESLDTKKRMPVYSNSKVSALEDIAIFTTGEEIPLREVFKNIYAIENKGETSVKKNASNDEVRNYFGDILPEYDKERVYTSDMKKVIVWYNSLLAEKIINDESVKETAEPAAEGETEKKTEVKAKAEAKPKAEPKPKVEAKKTAAPKQPATKVKKTTTQKSK